MKARQELLENGRDPYSRRLDGSSPVNCRSGSDRLLED